MESRLVESTGVTRQIIFPARPKGFEGRYGERGNQMHAAFAIDACSAEILLLTRMVLETRRFYEAFAAMASTR